MAAALGRLGLTAARSVGTRLGAGLGRAAMKPGVKQTLRGAERMALHGPTKKQVAIGGAGAVGGGGLLMGKPKMAAFQAAFFDELEKIKEAGIMGKATFVMGGPAVWAAGKLGGKAFKTAVRYSPQGLMARTARGVAGKKKGILPSLGRGAGKVMDFSSNLGQPLY